MTNWFVDLLERSRFLAHYPHYASVIARLEPRETALVTYMGVALFRPRGREPRVRLYINATYFRAHPEHFAAVLQHEIHHVVYGHLESGPLHRVAEPLLMEWAMEMSANEDIVEVPPDAGITWQQLQFCGMGASQSTLCRYDLLAAAKKRGDFQIVSEEQLDLLCPGWRNQQKAGDEGYRGPRIFVKPRNKLPSFGGRGQVITPSMRDSHRLAGRAGNGDAGLGDALDHGGDDSRDGTWGDRFGMGFPTDARCIASWQLRIQQHLGGAPGGGGDDAGGGLLPAAKDLPRHAFDGDSSGAMQWAAILRALLPVHRVVQPTWLRPNRRFPNRLGEVPGRQRRRQRPRLLVAIDTSASMTEEDLGRIAVELRRLAAHASVTVAECDAAVQRVYPVQHQETMFGGGDTSFAPVLAMPGVESRQWDAVVYFTDGKGMWPLQAPAVPVLWVLTNGDAFGCPYGSLARMVG